MLRFTRYILLHRTAQCNADDLQGVLNKTDSFFWPTALIQLSKMRFVTWLQRSDDEWSPSQSRTVRVGRNAHTNVSRARNASIPSHRQRKGSGAAADQSKLSLSRCCCSTVLCALSNAAPTRQSVCTC
jgi:hypothetical protein